MTPGEPPESPERGAHAALASALLKRASMRVLLLAAALTLTGCDGLVLLPSSSGGTGAGDGWGAGGGPGGLGGAGADTGGPGTGGGGTGVLAPRYACVNPARRGDTFGPLRRMTRPELEATLRDLLGAEVVATPALATALAGLPADEMLQLSTLSTEVPTTWPAVLVTVARQAATAVAASPVARARVFGACASASPIADDCARSFIRDFGLKAFRRPLDATELTQYFDFYKATGGNDDGLKFTLRRVLQDPSLTFHPETEGVVEGDRVRLDAYAVASRLSYATVGTMPDAALLSAAAAGQLSTTAELRSHAERLIATPAGKARVRDLMRYYMRLSDISDPYAPVAAARGIDRVGLGQELYGEALDFAERVFWDTASGTFEALMTSTKAQTPSPRVAKVLGLDCGATAAPPQVLPWNDASAFWAADGAGSSGPQQTVSRAGWYVWQLPSGRVTDAVVRGQVDLTVTSSSGPVTAAVNVNDVEVLAAVSLPAGAQRVTFNVSSAAQAALKIGMRLDVASGQSVTLGSLSLSRDGAGGCAASGESSDHPGLIHRPALLSSSALRTKPILRGTHVLKGLLCANLPTPDLSLVAAQTMAVGDLSGLSNREAVTRLTAANQCSACHRQINPIGFTFERFDQLGMARQLEQGFDQAGNPTMTWPIDTAVDGLRLDSASAVADSAELAQALARSPTAQACFAQTAYEFTYRRPINVASDGCALATSEQRVRSGRLSDALVDLIAAEDLFYRAP